jgi:hypothetical protein
MGIRGAVGGGGRGEEEEGGGAHLETPRGSGRRAHGERPELSGAGRERLWILPGFLCVLAPRAPLAVECRGELGGVGAGERSVESKEEEADERGTRA